MQGDEKDTVDFAMWGVWAHFFIASAHGTTHLTLGVPLAVWQMSFIGIVIVALPVVGLMIMLNQDRKLGAAIITVAMFASLAFGVLFHFVLNTPDNICGLAQTMWTPPFVATAILVMLSEIAGTVLGFRVWKEE